jgi:predicted ATPase
MLDPVLGDGISHPHNLPVQMTSLIGRSQEIFARLEDRFKLLTGGAHSMPLRQRTLRNTLDWSYDLLTEYALDRLMKSEELEDIRRQHVQFYLHIAEEAEQHLQGREQHLWLQRLDRESANLWAALRWVIEHNKESMRRHRHTWKPAFYRQLYWATGKRGRQLLPGWDNLPSVRAICHRRRVI